MLYRFPQAGSELKSVEILGGRKEPQALIYAPEGADHARLSAVTQALKAKGYLVLLDNIDGKDALRVEKFGTRDHLLSTLSQGGFTQGLAQVLQTPRDRALHESLPERAADDTKTAAGALFSVGDGLLVGSGLLRHNYSEAIAGGLWGLTGLVLAFFGKKHPDTEMGVMYRQFDDHLKKEGIEFPADEQQLLDALKRKDGIVQRADEFFIAHAADFHHAVQAVGAGMLAKGGFEQGNVWKGAAGLTCATGQTMGLVLNEKDPEPERHPLAYGALSSSSANENIGKTGLQGADGASLPPEEPKKKTLGQEFRTALRHPLLWSGGLPFVNNLLMLGGVALHDLPEKRKVEEHGHRDLAAIDGRLAEHQKNADIRSERFKQDVEAAPNDRHRLQKAYLEEDAERKGQIAKEMKAREKIVGIMENKIPLFGKEIEAHQLNVATAGCYMVANLLYAVSPKNTKIDLDRVGGFDELMAVAANIVTTQPASFQPAMINRVAAELSVMPDLSRSEDEIAQALSQKVAAISKSVWKDRVAGASASIAEAKPASPKAAWADQLTERHANANLPGDGAGAAIA